MKKTVSILLAVLFASMLVFCACSGENKPSGPVSVDMTVREIWDKVKEASGFGEMALVPTRDYGDIYGIDTAKIEESVWYMSENSATNADEFALMKVNDSAYVETLKKILEGRVETQLNVCRTYAPEQAAKLEKTEVVAKGDYVYYFVGDNYSAAMNVLSGIIK